RGYHVCFRDHADKVSRPVGWAEAGLYATPMTRGLRIAGTVEINSLTSPSNPARLNYLRDRTKQMFGPLSGDQEEWLGFRPTMPDALPVIGRSKTSDRILNAFGHQHIGLTLAGITGKIITDILQKKEPVADLTPFSDQRFKK
ncbi:MAG: FAD-dependent oxidoreductase, partial [Paracoccaceae bacterium]